MSDEETLQKHHEESDSEEEEEQLDDIPKIDIDITKLTPLSPEVISKQVRKQLSFICGNSSTAILLGYN
jgi:translation initiation factor 2 subunit 3